VLQRVVLCVAVRVVVRVVVRGAVRVAVCVAVRVAVRVTAYVAVRRQNVSAKRKTENVQVRKILKTLLEKRRLRLDIKIE